MNIRLILCIFLFLGACQKDYYSMVMEEGSCTQSAMTEACKDSMLRHFPIDHESFAQEPELENQVLDALHLLMTAPLSFPKDKKMLGLATIKEAEMHDFYDRFVKEDGANLNQNMVNYILHAADKIKQGCSSVTATAYYGRDGIRICRARRDSIYMASLLLHEARHSETGQHQVYIEIPNTTPWVPRGDIGMDGPCGWQVALLWGLVQGNSQSEAHLFHRYDIKFMISYMYDNFIFITGLPQSLNPVVKRKEFFADYKQHYPSIEQLSYPKAKTEISFSKEPKTFPTQIDLSQSSLPLVEDLDQDGNADVVLFGEGFQIFWGKKDQTLEESPVVAEDVSISKIMTIKSPNTGTRDLVLVDYDGNMYLAPIEKTRIQPMLKKIITLPTILRTVTVVDYNQDGQDDLVYQLYQDLDQIRILLGTETQGVFTDKTIPLTGESTANVLFSKLDDVNKDGHPDLLYYSPYTGIKDPILVGMWQPNDTFQVQSAQTKSLDFFQGAELVLFSSLNPLSDWFFTAERESRSKQTTVQLFSIETLGQLEKARRPYGLGESCSVSADSVLLFDLDQDGQEDLLFSAKDAGQQTMNLSWLTNVKDLDCDLSKTMEISYQDYEPQIALGDLDGDGYPEIISVDGRRTFSVFYNQGPRVASLRP